MSKSDLKAESIYNLAAYIKEEKLAPIYFFFGEDSFTISNAVKLLTKLADKEVASEFDKSFIDATKETTVAQIVDEASAFPFGGKRKLLVVKDFENVGEKKTLSEYVNNPAEFTILIITQAGKKIDLSREPHQALFHKKYLFEAQELKGQELNQWIVRESKKMGMVISTDNAWALIDLIGENKALLEMNLIKFSNYLNKGEEISPETIQKLTSITKEYTIFNLQDQVSAGNKVKSLEIAFNILETYSGSDPAIYIISMLSKFITTIARGLEFSSAKVPDKTASTAMKISIYYYQNCMKTRFFRSFDKLYQASEALMWADQTYKSSSIDDKTLITILISRMLA